mmetsp:Transcript_54516/g.145475  ORF Transcript_54516/g.145475 Transcript_54516/m.145475 type:complete len:123 (+) Transcript_54516:1740-2108(+)
MRSGRERQMSEASCFSRAYAVATATMSRMGVGRTGRHGNRGAWRPLLRFLSLFKLRKQRRRRDTRGLLESPDRAVLLEAGKAVLSSNDMPRYFCNPMEDKRCGLRHFRNDLSMAQQEKKTET